MINKSNLASLALLLPLIFSGCAPKELFSWVDRNCYVADWTNHYSCVSCCRNGGCQQQYPQVEYEMLVLGNQGAAEPSGVEQPAEMVPESPTEE